MQLLIGLPLLFAACSAVRPGSGRVEAGASATKQKVRDLGDDVWGLACVSLANAREQPTHKAEMATQIPMGGVLHVWKQAGHWFNIETDDGYHAWLEAESFVTCTKTDVEDWTASPLLIVTAFEDCVREQPRPDALPVSDVVIGCRLKKISGEGEWYQVELPDQRSGFLPKLSATDFVRWKESRHATPDEIERTAKLFLGRPYLWGANSPRGLDCSGLTKLVFFLSGIELKRNASQQATQGVDVPLDDNLSRLRKGDLVFFGHRARGRQPDRITHVGIYLGDKLFIHSSQRVRINSLDPKSPIRDLARIKKLLKAKRILPET